MMSEGKAGGSDAEVALHQQQLYLVAVKAYENLRAAGRGVHQLPLRFLFEHFISNEGIEDVNLLEKKESRLEQLRARYADLERKVQETLLSLLHVRNKLLPASWSSHGSSEASPGGMDGCWNRLSAQNARMAAVAAESVDYWRSQNSRAVVSNALQGRSIRSTFFEVKKSLMKKDAWKDKKAALVGLGTSVMLNGVGEENQSKIQEVLYSQFYRDSGFHEVLLATKSTVAVGGGAGALAQKVQHKLNWKFGRSRHVSRSTIPELQDFMSCRERSACQQQHTALFEDVNGLNTVMSALFQ